MNSLPFVNPTGVEYRSLLRVEDSALVVEFQRWSWRRWSKRLIEVRIPIEEVVSLQYKKAGIDLQLRSIQAAGEIPCRKPGLIEMRFAREHREAAQGLASRLRVVIAERDLERLDRDFGQIGG